MCRLYAIAFVVVSLALETRSWEHEPGRLRRALAVDECNHLRRIVPVGEDAIRVHNRKLTDCDALADDFVNKMPDHLKSPAEQARQKAVDRLNQAWDDEKKTWREWVPTPDEAAADAAYNAQKSKLAKEAADRNSRADQAKADQAKADAARAQDNAARDEKWKQYLHDLDAQRDQAALEEANKAARDAAARQKTIDDANAELRKQQQQAIDEARDRDKAQAAQDEIDRQKTQDQIKADEIKRAQDQAQADADDKQRIADQQLADDEAKAQRAKDRDARAAQRAEDERAREQRVKDAQQQEAERLERQQQAAKAEAERIQQEKDLAKEDEARIARENDAATAEEKRAADEAAFKKDEDVRNERINDFKNEEKLREQREQERINAAEDQARQARKDKDDANNADETPEEERPMDDKNEEPCDSKGTSSVTCEHGGKCFQQKGDPDKKRCQCRQDHKGDKCEHTPCENMGEKGNLVNGNCVKWDSEYSCLCDHAWKLNSRCKLLSKTSKKDVPDSYCAGIRKPKNKFENVVCELCRMCDTPLGNRNLVSAATPNTYDYSCDKSMIISDKPHKKPDAITWQKKAKYKHAVTFDTCQSICLESRGVLNNVKSTMNKRHCSWIFWTPILVKGAPTTTILTGVCMLFRSGVISDLAVPPGSPGASNDAGMLAFVSFPRRFDIYRTRTCTKPLKEYITFTDNVKHYVCFSHGVKEGEGTYYAGKGVISQNDGVCVATAYTMWDMALDFQARMKRKKADQKVGLMNLPDGMEYHRDKDSWVINGNSVTGKVPILWSYTLDKLMRVKKVLGIQDPANLVGARKYSPPEFEGMYRGAMYEPYTNSRNLPFESGHLIPAQQGPPNFFFNYVPQHKNSNCQGCWFHTEMAAAIFLKLGCHLEYKIDLSYEDPNPSDPDKCVKQYRPHKMRVEFKIKNAEKDSVCNNLKLAGFLDEKLIHVEQKTITTTRLMAYLLQKNTQNLVGLSTDAFDLKRLRMVATTMGSNDISSDVACFAETGTPFAFEDMEFSPSFENAFISTPDNLLCFNKDSSGFLELSTTKCLSWDRLNDGILDTTLECIAYKHDANDVPDQVKPSFHDSDSLPVSWQCAKFEYVFKGASNGKLTKTELWSNTANDWHISSLEDLVRGVIIDKDGKFCLNNQLVFIQVDLTQPSLAKRYAVCLQLRVNYYNVGMTDLEAPNSDSGSSPGSAANDAQWGQCDSDVDMDSDDDSDDFSDMDISDDDEDSGDVDMS